MPEKRTMRPTFPIEKPGIYRARNGKLLEITVMSHLKNNATVGDFRGGCITGTNQLYGWRRDGRCTDGPGHALDVVEFVSELKPPPGVAHA